MINEVARFPMPAEATHALFHLVKQPLLRQIVFLPKQLRLLTTYFTWSVAGRLACALVFGSGGLGPGCAVIAQRLLQAPRPLVSFPCWKSLGSSQTPGIFLAMTLEEILMNILRYSIHTLIAGCCLLLCASATFGQAMGGNGQKQGSILFYNIYTSSISNPELQNTRINITNTSNDPVVVHWFFVDSSNCTIADTFTCLTGNQTFSLLSSDYDPGVTGYVIAVAVTAQGAPRDFDFLIGTEYVKFASGHQANLPAESLALLNIAAAAAPVPDSGGTLVDLIFDDAGYERLPSDLALDNIPSLKDSNDTLLIINRIGGSLDSQTTDIGTLGGLLYNEVEKGFSFNLRTTGCQLRATLNDTFLRTSPPLSRVIGAGASGWIRLFTVDKVNNMPQGGATDARAILGAMINFNPTAQTTGQGFNQGHNLHRMINAPVTKLRMPVMVPAGC